MTSAPPSAAWHLRLLGGFAIDDGQLRLTRLHSRAAVLLLARLALRPGRDHGREELAALLWPEADGITGLARLRQTLSTVRATLERRGGLAAARPLVAADRRVLRLVPGALACDVWPFERACAAGDAATAQRLYAGELLPGFADEWVVEERLRLQGLADRFGTVAAGQVPSAVLPLQDPPALGDRAPPPLPVAHPSLALPLPAGRWHGDADTLAALAARASAERVLTLRGPGGIGKTRLAQELLHHLAAAGEPFDVLRFVSCVQVQALPALQDALLLALRPPSGSGDALARCAHALAGRRALLVLDNAEGLEAAALQWLMQALQRLPGLHLLLTSRRVLGLAGEADHPVPALALPAPGTPWTELARNPAVRLFVERAAASRADFQLHAGNAEAVAALVQRLQGLPLALELAASRVRSLPPARLLQLLREDAGAHLTLLARQGPRAGHDARQASISAVVDWSWRLLGADEQALLAALSCCAGGAGLPLLAAMTGDTPAQVAARLDALCGHSMARLAVTDTVDASPRGELVESVRDFVRARWPAPALQALQQALQRWLRDWALALGPDPAPGVIEAERRNVLAALSAPVQPAAVPLHLAIALRTEWDSAGMPAGVQQALSVLLQSGETGADPVPHGLASAAHELLAYVRFESGFVAQAHAHAEQALALAGDDPGPRARALVRQAWVRLASAHGEDDSGPWIGPLAAALDEALHLGAAAGDAEAQARALHQQAVLASQWRGDWALAEQLNARAQALWLALGDQRKADARLRNRGQCWWRLGRMAEAQQCFERCEQTARERDDLIGQIDSQLALSTLLAAGRQWRQALAADRRCIALSWQRWHRHGLAYALWNPPLSLARLRRPQQALQLMAFAATFWERSFGTLARADRQTVRRVRALVRAQIGAQRTEALWAEGAALPIARAVDLALTPWEDLPSGPVGPDGPDGQ